MAVRHCSIGMLYVWCGSYALRCKTPNLCDPLYLLSTHHHLHAPPPFYIFSLPLQSSKVIYEAWIKIPKLVDSICVLIITLPFISNNICSIAAGIFAYRGNDDLAASFTSALYYLWTFYTGFLGLLILYAGIRLLRLLNHHLLQRNDGRVDTAKIKLGALKVKIIILTGFVCLALFAVILGLYGALRPQIQEDTTYNLAIAILWTYDGVLATALIEFSVILKYEAFEYRKSISTFSLIDSISFLSFFLLSLVLALLVSVVQDSVRSLVRRIDLQQRFQTLELAVVLLHCPRTKGSRAD